MYNTVTLPDWANERVARLDTILIQLLKSSLIPFDEHLRGSLPESHGMYAIYARNAPPGRVLRAGRTITAAGGLRQRIYQNHFQGDQKGNLRFQLVKEGMCTSMEETKPWIRTNCAVQWVVVEDEEM